MKKSLLFCIALIILICFFPLAAGAVDNTPDNVLNNLSNTDMDTLKEKSAKKRTEITSMRTDDCRFYRNEDGTMTAELQLQKVEAIVIDNNLIPSGDSGSEYKNKSNRFKVSFPKELKKEALTFSYENTELIFELQDLPSISGNDYGNGEDLSTSEYVYGKKDTGLSLGLVDGSKIKYPGIMESTDLIYEVLDNGVKETLVLHDKKAPDKFSFKIRTGNLLWEEEEGGRVQFFSKGDRKELFYLHPVIAFDSKGKKVEGISQVIRKDENVLKIDLLVDKKCIKDSDYPIYIDPTVTLSLEQYAMCTYIDGTKRPSDPPIGNTNGILVGAVKNGLIKFNLSSLPRGTVTNANLIFNGTEGVAIPMSAYRVTQEWLESEATWYNAKSNEFWSTMGGSYDQASRAYCEFAYSFPDGGLSISFNLTSIIHNWVNGGLPNNGIIIKIDEGVYDPPSYTPLYNGILSVTYLSDVEPPSVNLTSPVKSSTVSGNLDISVSAQDPSGIQKVEFYVGNALIGTKTSSPYQVTWNTNNFPNGSYKIWAKAYDQAGNIGYTNHTQLCDTFDSTIKVETTNALWKDGYYQFNRYSREATLVSKTVTLSEPVKNAFLESSGQSGFTFFVSANGGTNWEPVTPGVVTPLQYPGTQLKFKAYTTSKINLYDYRLRCEKSSDFTVTVNNVEPVEPPTMLTAQSTADGKINLNWAASTTTNVSYRVYRSTWTGFTPSQDTLVAGGFSNTSYLEASPLVNGTTYYYKVTALNSTGTTESLPSNEVSITCGAGPQAPTGLSATPVNGGGIQLAWNASPTSGVTYRIYRDIISGFTPSSINLIASGVATTGFTDNSGLVIGTAYYYRVSAVTEGGAESLFSNEAGAVNGVDFVNTSNRLGVKPFWTYTSFPLARGEGMVNIGSGNLAASYTDSLLPGNRLVSEVRRTYNSLDKNTGAFGYGWSSNILQSLAFNPDSSVVLNQGDGYKAIFTYNSANGTYQAPAGVYLSLVKNADNSFNLTRKDNIKLFFDATGKLTSIKDPNNNTITYGYTDGKLTSITDTVGRVTTISYDSSGRISSIKDQRTNPTTYGYEGAGNLVSVTDPMGYVTRFTYDAACNMTEVTSPAGVKTKLNYDIYGHVTSITDGANNSTAFSWNFQAGQTVMTNPRSYNTTFTFNPAFGNVTSVSDALKGQVSYTFDANYNPTSITDPGGHIVNYTFDSMGNMLTRQDPDGTWIVTYNSLNLPLTVTGPDNGMTRYSYDTAGNLTGSTDPMNYSTTYENDSYGRRTKKIDPGSGIKLYGYNSYGNLTSLTNAESKTTTYTYNSMGNLASVTDPAGSTTRYTYDDLGRLTRTDYPDGTFTTIVLDGDDRVTRETNQNAGATNYGYDAVGRVTSVTDPRGYTTTYQYDQAGNRTKVTDPEGVYTTFAYDALNRLTSTADALNNVTTLNYDNCSNLTEVVHPLGHSEFLAYDSLHRKISSGRRESSGGANINVTTYSYDNMGNLVSTTDPVGNTTTYGYNLNNQLIIVTDATGSITTYGYDSCGNLTSVTNANNHTTAYTYDKIGRVKTEQLPGGFTTSWTYDNAGRVDAKTDPNGQTITYQYDTMGRLKKKAYPDTTSVTYTYDGLGNRLSMSDSLGTTQYLYDAGSNLIEITDCYGRKNNYTYNRANRRTGLTTTFGSQSYEYDTTGRLSVVTDFKGNRITLTYDADGRSTGISYPQGGTTSLSYNSLDLPVNIDHNTRNSNYYRIAYQYNAKGYISSANVNKNYSIGYYNLSYTYDNLNRLLQVSGTGYYNYNLIRSYTYDKLGNRLTHSSQETGLPDTSGAYTYNNLNNMVARSYTVDDYTENHTYGYDNNGNPITEEWSNDNKYSFYDSENRLIKTEHYGYPGSGGAITRYLYNGDGLLMGVINENLNQTEYYQYDGNQIIADLDGSGAVITSYTRLPSGKLLSMYAFQEWANKQRDTYYVFSDILGSTMMLFGMATGEVKMYEYEEFGGYKTNDGTDPTRFTFTGMPYFSGPGLYQMGARYYNPAVGRFITRDTYRGNIYQPWTQNLYAYCNNNPINYTDPTGHHPAFSNEAYDRMREAPERLKNQLFHGVWRLDNELTEYEKLVVFSPAWAFYRIGNADLPTETKQEYYNTYSEEFAMSIALMGAGGKGIKTKPYQLHHFATNKSQVYTHQIRSITDKYGLDLDDTWNKEYLQHQGRHPNAYHDYVLGQLKEFDSISKGNKNTFLDLFEQFKKEVINNPGMLTKEYWE